MAKGGAQQRMADIHQVQPDLTRLSGQIGQVLNQANLLLAVATAERGHSYRKATMGSIRVEPSDGPVSFLFGSAL